MLFVCGKNRWRSPTAEQIFSGRQDCEVMSAGIAAESETQLSAELIAWADTIFVMEGRHRKSIEVRFRAHIGNRKIVCLDIPDRYRFMEPDLVDLLYQRVTPHLR